MKTNIFLNKKEYPDNGLFNKVIIEEYCNLLIYPLVGILEKEAGILSDFVEAFNEENIATKYVIHGDHNLENVQFLKDNLLKGKQSQSDYIGKSDKVITYIDDSIKKHDLLKITDIMDTSIIVLLYIIGIFILYLIIDFMIFGGDLNKFFDKWVVKALWVWLPFYALWRLTKDIILKETKK